MARFRYRFQAALDAADDASRAAARAFALARRDVRRAAGDVERIRASDPATPLASALVASLWLVRALDCDRWSAYRAMRERACVETLERARADLERRRTDYDRLRRRGERLARHRDRLRRAFEAALALNDERERDEANARAHEWRRALRSG